MNINNIPDHPVAQNMMSTGYPDGVVPEMAKCPKCGEECDFYYIDVDGDIVGCENCISMYDAEEWLEREEEDNEDECCWDE